MLWKDRFDRYLSDQPVGFNFSLLYMYYGSGFNPEVMQYRHLLFMLYMYKWIAALQVNIRLPVADIAIHYGDSNWPNMPINEVKHIWLLINVNVCISWFTLYRCWLGNAYILTWLIYCLGKYLPEGKKTIFCMVDLGKSIISILLNSSSISCDLISEMGSFEICCHSRWKRGCNRISILIHL